MVLASLAGREEQAFLRIVEDRIQGQATIYYCLPLPYNALQSGRRYIAIHLEIPGGWNHGEKPFYAGLVISMKANPLSIDTSSDRILHTYSQMYTEHNLCDKLVLFLHRKVRVTGASTSETVAHELGNLSFGYGFRVPTRSGYNVLFLSIAYRRLQYIGNVPQSDNAELILSNQLGNPVKNKLLARNIPLTRVKPIPAADILSEYQNRVPHGRVYVISIESPRQDGGIDIELMRVWRANASDSRRHDPVIHLLAMLSIKVKDPTKPAAWFYKITRKNNGPCRRRDAHGLRCYLDLNLVYDSDNVELLLQKNKHLYSLSGESSENLFYLPNLDLHFCASNIRRVPEADYRGRLVNRQGEISGNQTVYISEFDSQEANTILAKISVDIGISLIPCIGDIVDIGEFVYACITGTDKWGDSVTRSELFLMGLAMFPLVPGAIRNLDSVNGDFRRTVQRYKAMIERQYPFSQALINFIRSTEKYSNLMSESVEEYDLFNNMRNFTRFHEKVFSMTFVRSLKIKKIIR